MQKHLLLFFLLCLAPCSINAQVWEVHPSTEHNAFFEEAQTLYPDIPKGLLQSIAYTTTHLRQVRPETEQASCFGLPGYYGVMGLVADGKGYFRENLGTIASFSSFNEDQIKTDPRANILAFAEAYHGLMQSYGIRSDNLADHIPVLDALSELPDDGNNYAFDSHLYSVLKNLNSPKFQQTFALPNYQTDLAKVFGQENYEMLSSAMVQVTPIGVQSELGQRYNTLIHRSPPPCSDVSGGFPHAVLSAAADPSNYSSRLGTPITHVTIHTMQGSYSGSISWFQNPAANVSAHYNIRASDGQITQSVCEIDKAWHVSNSNPYAIGIEHEGFIADPSWYTDVAYRVSADLTIDIAGRYSMPLVRTYDINGDIGINPISDGCFKIKGHQHFPAQTHVDPGEYWDWNRYYDLLNPVAAATTNTFTTCTGTFYDSGGPAGNYANDERIFYKIEPVGATSVTLTFAALDLELNYDYLYIYDGDSHNGELLATLNGTTLPGAIVANSGKMLLEFRTDCGTIAAGWDASWTCSTSAPSCPTPTGLTETVTDQNNASLDWDDVVGAAEYEVKIRRSLSAAWEIYYPTSSNLDVTGLAAGGLYIWQLRAICGLGDTSALVGREFVNDPSIGNMTTTLCSGNFTDSGSDLGNYTNNEDYTLTISPTNANFVSLNFNSFDLENNFDFMYFYDGPTTASPQIGPAYTGSTLPPAIVSTGGDLTIRFTSDNWTVTSGWDADWVCDAGLPTYPDTILLDSTMTGNLNCGLAYHNFFDSGSFGGFYGNNEDYTQTYCNPDTTKAIRLSFRPNPTADQHLSISSTVTGNDYLYIYNGATTSDNLIGAYTGASNAAPQPGTFISSGTCLTVRMNSDNNFVGNGWIGRLYCSDRPADGGNVMVGGVVGDQQFTDSGGLGGNYSNNENYTVTFLPDATAPAGEVVWAKFQGTAGLERNWDYLYVFDGDNTSERLICAYTGNATNTNTLGTIKATTANATGALTFQFFSDGGTTAFGWDAQMTTGAARLAYGAEECSGATPITAVGEDYAGSTMGAIGQPTITDPELNIFIDTLPECSGINTITRLENTLWYRFTTPDTLCVATAVNVTVDNISCQSESSSGSSGVQFTLYQSNSCLTSSTWGKPLYCADKLESGDTVDVVNYLQPSTNYYIMIDGFTGQNCNFDIRMDVTTSGDPNSCVFPLELLSFRGEPSHNFQAVDLFWETAYEADVQGFYVQRAAPNGVDFEDIGFVQSFTDPNNHSADYTYVDEHFWPDQVNYYRLREVDYDGIQSYHKIIGVDMRDGSSTNTVLVYPNPARDIINFTMNSSWEGDYHISFFDIRGKLIYRTKGDVNVGLWREGFNIGDLPVGIYTYQLQFGYTTEYGKFEKF